MGDESFSAGAGPLWEPSREDRERAELTRFMRWIASGPELRVGERDPVRAAQGCAIEDYGSLWEWSVGEVEEFWAAIWEYCGVIASKPYERVLDSPEMPGARWFEGAELNYAQNMLMRERDPGEVAVVHCSEVRPPREITWGELTERVGVLAAGLRELGVGRGDRVAAYMPNIPETLTALLACASIGAIFSSAAPEFGARSVIDRFAQISPKVLLGVDGYRHGGRDFERMGALESIAGELPGLEHTVLLAYLDREASPAGLPGGIGWEELMERGRAAYEGTPTFAQVPFDHPLWVLYSSGTTGLPKAIVHSQGGILLEQLKKARLHLDLRAGDRMFWFTTTGWMMWNFLIGCLFSEAAIVLYDGSPGHPDMGALWRLAKDSGMTCMGLSAGYLAACEKAGVEPARELGLERLRAIGSTGSPLSPESFRWVYEHVRADIWLFSTSGGTDVCTAFVGGCPLLPVYEGELQCRILGCAVESFDEAGNSLVDEVGELVLTRPLPSMPLFFWGEDPPRRDGSGGERYRESYFSMYPGVWRHGDWIRITPRGGAVIYGRSDATINRQGVRMGTSEIYRAAGAVREVTDALVVDVPREGELWMVLFVVLAPGIKLGEELRRRIAARIREDVSPRHVPNEILQIEEVPRTLSGKILEVPVKKILMGAPPARAASVESLANPGALDYFVELAKTFQRFP
ncbi:MAG TPA: acetoacetate--CoA ligase [Solirubrobacteraceae bacterium]|nr:acetoacetate--CoA ligase [Solirubrobacteraceae bacterium]